MEKPEERKILLRRLFYKDGDLYKIGRLCGLAWFNDFAGKFERDKFAYFADDERRKAIDEIADKSSDVLFIEALNSIFREESRYLSIDRFVGEHYYFDVDGGLRLDNHQGRLHDDVLGALRETKKRGYYFLKALVELYREGKWDRAYGGATWIDILAKIRELGGIYPPPRDLALLKSYKLYYKTGSNRYPTHTIPEEMIPVVEEALSKMLKTGKLWQPSPERKP